MYASMWIRSMIISLLISAFFLLHTFTTLLGFLRCILFCSASFTLQCSALCTPMHTYCTALLYKALGKKLPRSKSRPPILYLSFRCLPLEHRSWCDCTQEKASIVNYAPLSVGSFTIYVQGRGKGSKCWLRLHWRSCREGSKNPKILST